MEELNVPILGYACMHGALVVGGCWKSPEPGWQRQQRPVCLLQVLPIPYSYYDRHHLLNLV